MGSYGYLLSPARLENQGDKCLKALMGTTVSILPRSRTIPVLMPFVTIALAAIAGGVLRPLSSAGPGGWSTDKKSVPDAEGSGNIL